VVAVVAAMDFTIRLWVVAVVQAACYKGAPQYILDKNIPSKLDWVVQAARPLHLVRVLAEALVADTVQHLVKWVMAVAAEHTTPTLLAIRVDQAEAEVVLVEVHNQAVQQLLDKVTRVAHIMATARVL
jgi:hypothetical protein